MLWLSSDLRLILSLLAYSFTYCSAFATEVVEPVEFYRVPDEVLAMPAYLQQAPLACVAFSADSKWIAVGDLMGRVSVSKNQSQVFKPVLLSPYRRPILQVAVIHQGDTVLCRDDGGRLFVCNVANETILQTIQQESPIVSFAYDQQRSRVLTVSASQKLTEWSFDKTAEQPLMETNVREIQHPFTRISISEGGQTLLLASTDTWQVRRLSDLKRRVEATVPTGQISMSQISPDGLLFAVGFEDGKIRVRETKTGELRYSWTKHPNRVLTMAFSHTGKTLISGCQKDRIVMWDLERGEHANNCSIPVNIVSCLALSPNDQHLAVVGSLPSVSLLRPRKPTAEVAAIAKPRTWNTKAAFAVRIVPEKNQVLVVPKFGTAESINLDSMKRQDGQKIDPGKDRVNQVHIAPDGSLSAHCYQSGNINFYDVNTGLLTKQLRKGSTVQSLQFDPTSKQIAILERYPTPAISIVDVATDEVLMGPVQLLDQRPKSVCWAPDSKAIYTSGLRYDSNGIFEAVSKWSAKDGTLLAEGKSSPPAGHIAISPDGQHIVTGGIAGLINVFDDQLELKKTFECGGLGGLNAFCFVNNRRLVVGTFKGSVVMVDIQTGTELSRFEPLPARIAMPIRSIDYAPGQKLLAAVGGYDHNETIRLYRLEAPQP